VEKLSNLKEVWSGGECLGSGMSECLRKWYENGNMKYC
jgi:hypothetical protein